MGLLTLARAGQRRTPPLESPRRQPRCRRCRPHRRRRSFTASDASVTVAVALTQEMPPWRPPTNIRNGVTLSGLVRVIIDGTGKVERDDAPRNPPELRHGASQGCAHLDLQAGAQGQPVKYAKVIEVQLQE